MLFNSLPFLFLFLPVAYLVFWRLQSKEHRYQWMALAGYIFYSFWNYKFCALMAFSTLVSFGAGLGMRRWTDLFSRRMCLVVPICVDLALLAFFKYADFALLSVGSVLTALGKPARIPALNIILPVGISFYTFHTITYIVDCYRGVIRPTRSLSEFACYVSLFPQLVAGPIVRFRQIEADLDTIGQHRRKEFFDLGWSFFAVGMIKKVLIADTLAAIIDPVLAHGAPLGTASAWLCALGYTYQLYFDFSGYSDMAVGLGLLFGLRLPQNFDSPYKATGPSDFWRRWHISLSSVLRDYLFIPLGGSRGSSWATARNLLITMLLGGLWHGAGWTFLAWGGYHGLLLLGQRVVGPGYERLPGWFQRAATFLLVVVGWVLFRSTTFTAAAHWINAMFSWSQAPLPAAWGSLLALIFLAGSLAHFGPNSFELKHEWNRGQVLALTALFGLCLFSLYGGVPSPFLYFQF